MKTRDYSRVLRHAFLALGASMALLACAQADTSRAATVTRDGQQAWDAPERVVALVNDLRARNGVATVARDGRLDAAADALATYMARTGRLDHNADGTSPRERVKQRGYDYCKVSENIAFEYSSRGFSVDALARNFVGGWGESATHRANMLDPVVTQTGIGVARNGKGEYYAVQVFARPRAPGAACPR